MTDAEQGALLLAHQRGKVIEWSYGLPWKTEHSSDQSPYKPRWCAKTYYRIRPEPKVETKTVWYPKIDATIYADNGWAYTHKITFDLVDGEPDVSTVKMEKL